MTKMIYEQPTIEVELLEVEQGYALIVGIYVPDGENNGEEGWV